MTGYTDFDGISDAYRDWLNGDAVSRNHEVFFDPARRWQNAKLSVRARRGLFLLCESRNLTAITVGMFKNPGFCRELSNTRNIGVSTFCEISNVLENEYGTNSIRHNYVT